MAIRSDWQAGKAALARLLPGYFALIAEEMGRPREL